MHQCVNYGLFLRLGNLAYLSGGDCGWAGRGPNSVVQIGVWQHVAAVASGNNVKLYVNGVQTDNINLASAIGPTNNQQLWIGNSVAGLPNYIDASIDEIRIWNIARTADEIADNMNVAIDCATPGLVAYYRFDHGIPGSSNFTETTLEDCSSNANNGTLLNFALNGSSSNWVSSTVSLPVNFIGFSAHASEKGVLVQWSTNEEIDNLGFEVQRSVDGKNWHAAGFVDGSSYISRIYNYQFLDDKPFFGTSYYRLKQVDVDGTFVFTEVISVVFQKDASFAFYPHPVKDEVSFSGITEGKVRIMSCTGNTLFSKNFTEAKINLSALPKGVYFISVYNDDQLRYTRKLIKQ